MHCNGVPLYPGKVCGGEHSRAAESDTGRDPAGVFVHRRGRAGWPLEGLWLRIRPRICLPHGGTQARVPRDRHAGRPSTGRRPSNDHNVAVHAARGPGRTAVFAVWTQSQTSQTRGSDCGVCVSHKDSCPFSAQYKRRQSAPISSDPFAIGSFLLLQAARFFGTEVASHDAHSRGGFLKKMRLKLTMLCRGLLRESG